MGQAHNPTTSQRPNGFLSVLIGIGLVVIAGLGLVYWDERKGTAHVNEQPPATVQSAMPEALPPVEQTDAPTPMADKSVPLVADAPKPAAKPEALVIRRILPIKSPIRYGDWMWDEKGVPAGVLIVTVDLEARVLSVFRDGYEIGAAAVLLGTQEKPTPLGVFPITQKDEHHISNLYNAPMPYMMRLTNDGVSIHGSNVRNGYASHGCIGVPKAFAQKLFARAKLGDRVIITRGKQAGLGAKL
ncbi:L,D-transpeptidase [Novosphingobium umbonatum]|uniref:L,D-transpeptidase n=1 Tax=Novosphingobium umbonatum TaxID=1908524 RepID=A0A3S2X4E8_9SPHN|nr:L,D-transpeptidase family protein [Novosphingobium umbonatum]RVU05475.1 L,D-transpeptidase [Novosphingobium umbonatum]